MEKSKSGRRYDAEFKENAVALVRSGRKISHVARDLGVGVWTVSCWVRASKNGQQLSQPKTLTVETAAERENRRLRQENEYLRRQRDILKKALAIVSDGNLPGASNS
jgi:transposase